MTSSPGPGPSRPWVIVLAGGHGRRLEAVAPRRGGDPVPKQFCSFGGSRSLLQAALARARDLAGAERVLPVVLEAHRPFWRGELAGLEPRNIIVQPSGRGTAVAVLHALSRLPRTERDPVVVILPSDQEVEDEAAWRATLRRAAVLAHGSRDRVVLVGAEPQADPAFGWILPGPREDDGAHAVRSFVEKPSRREAAILARRGGLCSTFVLASRRAPLEALFRRHVPRLVDAYGRAVGAVDGPDVSAAAFAGLPDCDLSRDVLEQAAGDVRVLHSPPCGWTDLGTPERLARWLAGRRPLVRAAAPALEAREEAVHA